MADPRPPEHTPSPEPRKRVLELIEYAYEAAFDAADRGFIDFSAIGAPLAQALALLRDEEAA